MAENTQPEAENQSKFLKGLHSILTHGMSFCVGGVAGAMLLGYLSSVTPQYHPTVNSGNAQYSMELCFENQRCLPGYKDIQRTGVKNGKPELVEVFVHNGKSPHDDPIKCIYRADSGNLIDRLSEGVGWCPEFK